MRNKNNIRCISRYIFRLLAKLRVFFFIVRTLSGGALPRRMRTCNLHTFVRNYRACGGRDFREWLRKSVKRTAGRTLLSHWPSVRKQETETAACLRLKISRRNGERNRSLSTSIFLGHADETKLER